MKKLLVILLAVLMIVPFGALAVSAEKVEVPAEPVPFKDAITYVSYGSTAENGVTSSNDNPGTSADKPLATWAKLFEMVNLTGGIVCFPGKGYVGANFTIVPCANPVTLTAYDPQLNKRYEGTIEVDKGDGTFENGTQRGMIMIASGRTLTIEAECIFENVDFLERNTDPTTISVSNGGKLVVKEDVNIYKMTNANATMVLNVDAGSYVYLKTSGFSKYTGDGTIVIAKDLYNSDKFDGNMFLEFNGAIVDTDGTVLFGNASTPDTPDTPDSTPDSAVATESAVDSETQKETSKATDKVTDKATSKVTEKADNTTKAPDTTDKADTEADEFPLVPVIIGGVAAVVIVAAVIIIILKKKKAE